MSNQRTVMFRRRFRRSYLGAVLSLFIAIGSFRVVQLSDQGDWQVPIILLAAFAGFIFLYSANLAFGYQTELKRLAMIANQRVYGGGREFVEADDARDQLRNDDNIWGRCGLRISGPSRAASISAFRPTAPKARRRRRAARPCKS